MQARLDFRKAAPDAYQAVAALDRYVVRDSGLEPRLVHLIKIRASQINGCAYCVDMHIKHAREDGLGQQWIDLLSVWRESPIYTARERALLGWTEALTLLAETRAPDDVYDELRRYFSEEETTKLTVAIGLINVWNRVAVGFRSQHRVDVAQAAE
ncbi:carboxymuconolactone decarboxylase family protein [Paradevosia shaoguanensis]|uniref:Carboxymuconolactone decarboxylase family protein n=1 Tax=Paradevosia shaoguanensis TaxID=1335043 RepID=A0AA41QP58_9HYPH|nr:carboxymuconolactone decarboxylase family protein [Paradevosia shaoguanensis]MCF1743954.1 carboxymuconolactone decarboxylase family protein [Paradevosia shaoguanensis]MCI0128437.1 carboxymuconolactone decarboxylase family protein [Paradevosia shaoguanensis]